MRGAGCRDLLECLARGPAAPARSDLARMPAHRARYDSRASVLTGALALRPTRQCAPQLSLRPSRIGSSPRAPRSRSRPDVGVLHADQRNRDSFALDAMEPIRPAVDAFVLDLLEERILTSHDFAELPNGICRVRAPLTHELALTLGRWRLLLARILTPRAGVPSGAPQCAVRLTRQDLAKPRPLGLCVEKALKVHGRTARRPRFHAQTEVSVAEKFRCLLPSSAQSPLRATPRKVTSPRPYASKGWGAPRPEAPPLPFLSLALDAGEPLKSVAVAIARTACRGRVASIAYAQSNAHAKRCVSKHSRATTHAPTQRRTANGATRWSSSGDVAADGSARTPTAPVTIAPRYFAKSCRSSNDVPLSAIASATGLSLATCSRYRAGARVPHPRRGKRCVPSLWGWHRDLE